MINEIITNKDEIIENIKAVSKSMCNVDKLESQKDEVDKDMSDLAIKIFENGYDARFQTAQMIPVLNSYFLTYKLNRKNKEAVRKYGKNNDGRRKN